MAWAAALACGVLAADLGRHAPGLGTDEAGHGLPVLSMKEDAVRDVQKAPSTHLVVSGFGDFTAWHDGLMDRYLRQLEGTGVKLSFLRDATDATDLGNGVAHLGANASVASFAKVAYSSGMWTQATSEWASHDILVNFAKVQISSRRGVLHTSGSRWSESVPVCDVKASSLPEGSQPTDGHFSKNPRWGYHSAFVAAWWKDCAQQLEAPDHVWFVESDAVFNGDVAKFVAAHAGEGADMIASRFMILDRQWPGWFDFARRFSADFHGFSELRVGGGEAVEHGAADRPGRVALTEDGSLHAKVLKNGDFVVRYSAKLLGMLAPAIQAGIVGTAEGEAGMLCANRYGLKPGDDCALYQFDLGKWASPVFNWDQGYPDDSNKIGAHCSAAWQDKWVHKVKAASWEELQCSAAPQ